MELRAGERELYEGRPSWRALMSFYLLGLGIVLIGLIVALNASASLVKDLAAKRYG